MGQIIFEITNSSNATDSYTYNAITGLAITPNSFSIKSNETFDLKTISLYVRYQDGSSRPLTWNEVVIGPLLGNTIIDGNFIFSALSNENTGGNISISYTEGPTTTTGSISYTITALMSKPVITGPSENKFQIKSGSVSLEGENLANVQQVKYYAEANPANPVDVSILNKGTNFLTIDISSLPAGRGSFIAVSPEGNSNTYAAEMVAELEILSVNPNPVLTDSDFVISGEFFGTVKGQLLINDRDISTNIKAWSDTSITVTATLDMYGDNLIKVINAHGTSSDSVRLVVDISGKYKPEITKIEPTVEGILPFQLKIYGYNLFNLKSVFVGASEVGVLNSWCDYKDAMGHALGMVTIVCKIGFGTQTGPVRVVSELGTAIGPVLEIKEPKLLKVTPSSIQIKSTQTGPYNFIVEGEWLSPSSNWYFNGVSVNSKSGSIKNRFALTVAKDLVMAGTATIKYQREESEAVIDINVTDATPAYDTTPKLFSASIGEFGKEVTVTAVNTSMSSCKLLLNNSQIATSEWLCQQGSNENNPSGTDYIKFTVTNDIEPGALMIEYEQDGVTKYTNAITFEVQKPAITAISVDNGIPGDDLILTTTNAFDAKASSKVYLGKTLCPIVSWTNTSVKVKVPNYAETGNIYLETKHGRSNSFKFTVNVTNKIDPIITDISPTEAYVGEYININGNDFGSRMGEAYVGDIKANVTAWTSEQITIKIPVGAVESNVKIRPYSYNWDIAGPVVGILTTESSTEYRKNAFNPFITQVSPSPVELGGSVTISGLNFSESPQVKIGDMELTDVVRKSRNLIVASVPTGCSGSYLTITNNNGDASNSKKIGLSTSYPTISYVQYQSEIGGILAILGSGFGSFDSMEEYSVSFGESESASLPQVAVKSWSYNKIEVLLIPEVDYSAGYVFVTANGVNSNKMPIAVNGVSTASTANPSLGYITNGYAIKNDSGITFPALDDIQKGSPKVDNLSAEKIDGHSYSDLIQTLDNVSNASPMTISGVKPDRTGNIKLRGINGVTVITRNDDAPGNITIKGLTDADLLVDASTSKLYTSYCDTFGVCRIINDSQNTEVNSKAAVTSVVEGPGLKITRYSVSGDIFIDGVNIGKEMIVLSPKFDKTSFGVCKGNHSHGTNSTARYFISQKAKDFLTKPDLLQVFGTAQINKTPVYNRISNPMKDKVAIYNIYPHKAPEGALVGVIGSGFTENSRILIGSQEVPAYFMSSNELQFKVPSNCFGNITIHEGEQVSNEFNFVKTFVWTDNLKSGVTPVKATHINEMIDNLNSKLSGAGITNTVIPNVAKGGYIDAYSFYLLRSAVNACEDEKTIWTDAELLNSTLISAVHIQEIRRAINNLNFTDNITIDDQEVYLQMAKDLDIVYHNFKDSYPNQDTYPIYYASIEDGYQAE